MLLYILSFEINGIRYVGSIPVNGYLKPFHPTDGHMISVVVHQIDIIYPFVKPVLTINAAIASIIGRKAIHLPRPGRYEKLIQFHSSNPRQNERHQRMIEFIKDGSYDYTSYKKYAQEANRLCIKPMEKRAYISLFNFASYNEPGDDPDNYIPDNDGYEPNPADEGLPPSAYIGNY